MPYKLKLHREAEKQLERIPQHFQVRIVEALRGLRINPRPPGYLKLDDHLYRIREGEYRIIYAIFDQELVVLVVKLARRSEAIYRDLRELLKRAKQSNISRVKKHKK